MLVVVLNKRILAKCYSPPFVSPVVRILCRI